MRLKPNAAEQPSRQFSNMDKNEIKNNKRGITIRLFFGVCLLFLISAAGVAARKNNAPREQQLFNDDWLFQKNDPVDAQGKLAYEKIKDWVLAGGNEFVLTPGAVKWARPNGNMGEDVAYTKKDFDDSAWRKLNLPHDWAIEGDFQENLPGETGKRPFAGTGWYRKHFTVSPADIGRQIYIEFDGAMAYPAVWLNGKFVGGWAYGYSSFQLDLTPYLEPGRENILAVRVENLPESSRWYPGAGIYRNVRLIKTAPVHAAQWGTFVTTPVVSRDAATVNVRVTIENDSAAQTSVIVKNTIYKLINGRKSKTPAAGSAAMTLNLPAGSRQTGEVNLVVNKPELWNTQTPNFYTIVTEIRQNNKPIDLYETNFGIRTIKFDAVRGFLLNGENVEIKGVCLHHDLGALGTAVNVRALERQIEIMKEMGANAIRTSHNPPAPELLDLADKMGVLIMDEAFDAWTTKKKDNDYHLLYADWHEKDLRSMVRRDRNHPSVILWSTGNEIPDQKKPEGPALSAALTKIVHEEDATRPVTNACDVVDSGFNGFQKTVDVFGYNYKPQEYGRFGRENSEIPLIGSETVSAISSRGEYFFPIGDEKSKGNSMVDFQVNSYDFFNPAWVREFAGQEKNPFVAGEFVWTGFDYLGEPAPYWDLYWIPEISDPQLRTKKEKEFKETGKITPPSRSSYFGIVDLCGFKKDRFYAYQARWRPELPMAHIFPHWNWADRAGQVTPVQVYTSGDEAELFLNGKSLGRKKKEPFQYRLNWNDVVYEPGELKVVAYKNNRKWAEDIVRTTGAASQITMKADRARIEANGRDLSFITVTIADKNNLIIPRANNRVKFEISGAAEIVAVDNGDASDPNSFQSTNRRVYNGMALIVVRSLKNRKGTITIRAASGNLKAAELKIQSGF